jgi:hypothetical protein
MCTVTFIPKPGGYLLGMNRDESVLRETALLPQVTRGQGMEAVYPREGATGGTWIAANEAGTAMTLLNQNHGAAARPRLRSRGGVIPALIHLSGMAETAQQLEATDFGGMLPFLLAAVFPDEQRIAEWKWDGESLRGRSWSWQTRHWFSSGISDALATQVRSSFCEQAWSLRDAGSPGWLRSVHVSHAPVRGSFSVCVHRPEAVSVSYTEIAFDSRRLDLRYHAGAPCEAPGRFDAELTLHAPGGLAAGGERQGKGAADLR